MDLWHRRLGHISPQTLKLVYDKKTFKPGSMQVEGNDIHGHIDRDVDNHMNARRSHVAGHRYREDDEVSQIGDRVYSDIAGPFPTSLLGGKKYVISFTDAFSRYAICYFLVLFHS